MRTSTPRTDANEFSATTEKPSSGDYELVVVYADFARGLEMEADRFRAALRHVETCLNCMAMSRAGASNRNHLASALDKIREAL